MKCFRSITAIWNILRFVRGQNGLEGVAEYDDANSVQNVLVI